MHNPCREGFGLAGIYELNKNDGIQAGLINMGGGELTAFVPM